MRRTLFHRCSLAGLALLALASCLAEEGPLPEEEEGPEAPPADVAVLREKAALLSTCAATTAVDNLKELMIVDPSVVESPEASNATGSSGGPLSFHGVMTRLAGGQDVAAFTERWLTTWASTQTAGNGAIAGSRSSIALVLQPFTGLSWPRTADGKLDMAQAPFRLLAVVNRMDLMGTAPGKPNGEARLVYGWSRSGDKLMTVIFEFNLPATPSLRGWATRWHQLGSVPFGSAFNTALANDVVSRFVAPENLSQLRTNERLFDTPWNLREFTLVTGSLRVSTVAQTPAAVFNDPASPRLRELVTWIQNNQSDIVSDRIALPASFQGAESIANTPGNNRPVESFRGSRWLVRLPSGVTLDERVRAAFAQRTCNGCHNSDAGRTLASTQFYHVDPTRELLPGLPGGDGTARLSDFVKNTELPARNQILSSLLSCPCVATYRVLSRTSTGTESAVTTRNISTGNVSAWDVAWKYGGGERVTSVTSAVAVPQTETGRFRFRNTSSNGFMVPGGTRTFRLVTSTVPGEISPVPPTLFTTCR